MRSNIFTGILAGLFLISSMSAQTAYDQYQQARKLKDNDNVQALAEVDKAISLAGKGELFLRNMYELRAELLSELGRYKDAVDEYTRVLKTSADPLFHQKYRADANCRVGRYQDAIADYAASLPWKGWDDRSRGGIIAERARCHLTHGRKDLALADIELAIATSKRSALAFNLRGKIKMAEGKTEAALEDFTNAIVADASIEFERDRSDARIKLGKTELAYQHVDVLIKNYLHRGDDRYYVHRGELAFRLGRTSDAIADATRVITKPGSFRQEIVRRDQREAFALRAAVYCSLGRKAEAAADEAEIVKIGGKVAKRCA